MGYAVAAEERVSGSLTAPAAQPQPAEAAAPPPAEYPPHVEEQAAAQQATKEEPAQEQEAVEEAPKEELLPGIEGLRIIGDPVLGNKLTACGHSVNGTALCVFQVRRDREGGQRRGLSRQAGLTLLELCVTVHLLITNDLH